jgi:hypothetical protein
MELVDMGRELEVYDIRVYSTPQGPSQTTSSLPCYTDQCSPTESPFFAVTRNILYASLCPVNVKIGF